VELGHSDPIETVTFKHEEGNEGEKIGVKRGNGAFYGGKLLKRQGRAGRSGAILTLKGGPSKLCLGGGLRRERFLGLVWVAQRFAVVFSADFSR
jgi:hypothetical protein